MQGRRAIATGARDPVVLEIAHQFGRAPFFHHAFQAAPRRFGTLWRTTALGLDVAQDVIDVDLIAAGRGVFGILFLEFVRFGLFAHATTGQGFMGHAGYKRKRNPGARPASQSRTLSAGRPYFTRSLS